MGRKNIAIYLISGLAIVLAFLGLILNKSNNSDNNNSIDFKVDQGYLKWRESSNDSWTTLYDLSLLEGQDGINGKDGLNGINGINGKDGREVEFIVDKDILFWRYVGDDDWRELFYFNQKDDNDSQVSLVTSVDGSTTDLGCLTNGKLCSLGTEMTIRVNDEEIFAFYVIDDTNDILTLIGVSNIGNSSITTLKWYDSSKGDTSYGPITLLGVLNTLTRDWTNISYIKDYRYNNTGSGYQGLTILDGVSTIKDEDGNNNTVVGLSRARLLTREEVVYLESIDNNPTWLYANMDGESYTLRPYGYWLLTTATVEGKVYNVRNNGTIATNSAADASGRGIRAVIQIRK